MPCHRAQHASKRTPHISWSHAESQAPVQAVTAIVGIIAGGRLIVRPAYHFIANIRNSDVFAATTLLIVLGTSVLTQLAGLSLALGAFLVCPMLLRVCVHKDLALGCCRSHRSLFCAP